MSRFLSELRIELVSDSTNSGRGTWRLTAPLVYRSDLAKQKFTVPAGFETDFASVPRAAYVLGRPRWGRIALVADGAAVKGIVGTMRRMKMLTKLLAATLAVASCAASAATPQMHITPDGVKYGIIPGSPDKPLVLVLTTDVHDSLSGAFTTVSQTLGRAGYPIAAIDVTCHGQDVRRKETAGLDCWAQRVKVSRQDIFLPMVKAATSVITDVGSRTLARPSDVVVVGVSRGGYAALRIAAADARVTRIVAMAPVTNIARLDEFKGMSVDQRVYGLAKAFPTFARDHIFMQIGNADTRVGTADALAFEAGVVGAAGNSVADFTTVITPLRGHGTAMHDEAAQWVLKSFGSDQGAVKRAP